MTKLDMTQRRVGKIRGLNGNKWELWERRWGEEVVMAEGIGCYTKKGGEITQNKWESFGKEERTELRPCLR